MLGILLIRGLCGFAGNSNDAEGNRETGLAVALRRYLGLVGDLKEKQMHWIKVFHYIYENVFCMYFDFVKDRVYISP